MLWQARELDRPGVRVVPRANLHVTLAFLGATPRSRIADVATAVGAAASRGAPPAFSTRGYRETRSVGMVALEDEDGRGGRLADELGRGLEHLGLYRPERRPWLPHVTVARFRARPRLEPSVPELGRVVPSEATVNMSVLRATGAQYRTIESVALGG